ncbi:MAG: PqqD family protein [Eubacteriales bacterium]|nr:PqqD family protein [Eubacteriales bacterium]
MKIKNDFIIREIAGEYIVIPTGRTVLDFNGLITLNEIGVLLWKLLQKGTDMDEMIRAVLEEYEVEEAVAREDILAFIEKLDANHVLIKEDTDEND